MLHFIIILLFVNVCYKTETAVFQSLQCPLFSKAAVKRLPVLHYYVVYMFVITKPIQRCFKH